LIIHDASPLWFRSFNRLGTKMFRSKSSECGALFRQ
jgi:hypothetical protein